MSENKISVIIPVYNIEQYLDKCIESVVNQTYKNLEIILVDDGSTDKSGVICDEWKEKDERIIVIHKENGGVASARNVGLTYVTGDYIAWIDSDDWIERNVYEIIIREMLKYNCDISVIKYTQENSAVNNSIIESVLYDNNTALQNLLRNRITPFLWDKIYKSSLFKNINFVGQIGEDSFANYEIFKKATKICDINYTGYHWIRHEGSLMTNKAKTKDCVCVWLKIRENAMEHYPKMEKDVNYRIMHDLLLVGCKRNEYDAKIQKILKNIKWSLFKNQHWIDSTIFEKKVLLKSFLLFIKNS